MDIKACNAGHPDALLKSNKPAMQDIQMLLLSQFNL